MQYLEGADRENTVVAFLDRKGNLLGLNTVSVGGLHSSIVHPREVFKPAIIMGAASVILCHNHPSGDTTPSKEDIDITRRLINAGEIIGIQILDHVIVGDDNYYSLKEHGLI
jgi:DNA repair protein RadC